MFGDPVLVLGPSTDEVARTVERGRTRGLVFTIFTRDLFSTFDDEANRAAIASIPAEALEIVGVAMRAERRTMDKVLKGLKLLDS